MENKRTAFLEKVTGENDRISIGATRVKDNKKYFFSAHFDGELSGEAKIVFCHGKMMAYGKWIEITPTELKVLGYVPWAEPQHREKIFLHDLTLKNFVDLTIVCDPTTETRSITLKTDGGEFFLPGNNFNSCDGEICAYGEGITLTDVNLGLEAYGYDHDIWIIGASYLSLFDPSRWPHYWYLDGGAGPFLSGRGGMGAQHGMEDLLDALKYGTPKILMWDSVSGNNPDKDDVLSPLFYDNTLEMLKICKEKGIKVYIQTMPNNPVMTNIYKNDVILNRTLEFANYEYEAVDLARALDAKAEKNPSWYPGMLYTDNVHPRQLGARASYLAIIVDAPELIIGRAGDVFTKTAENLSDDKIIISGAEATDDSAITFRADFKGAFDGKITIGNGESEGSFITVDKDDICVYNISDGKAKLTSKEVNPAVMQDLVNLKIKIKDGKASIALMSVSEKDFSLETPKTRLDTIVCDWNASGEVFASVSGQELSDVRIKLAK